MSLEAALKIVALDGLIDLSRLAARIKVVPAETGKTAAGAEGTAGLLFPTGFFLIAVFVVLLAFLTTGEGCNILCASCIVLTMVLVLTIFLALRGSRKS